MYQYKEKYTIDFRDVKNYYDMHFTIRDSLEFPDYYGCNWSAFWDCLTDMYGDPVHIEIIGLEVIERKFGVMTGPVKYLEPLERGESGRICKLRIVGELKTITVGKELEIRRILSKTHLKSSAFDVEYTSEGKIVLHGRGWGHGVGLCQIGAAVMATRGYDYRQILTHYYPGSDKDPTGSDNGLLEFANGFGKLVDAIEGAPLKITAEQALRVVKIMEAAFESAKKNQVINTQI